MVKLKSSITAKYILLRGKNAGFEGQNNTETSVCINGTMILASSYSKHWSGFWKKKAFESKPRLSHSLWQSMECSGKRSRILTQAGINPDMLNWHRQVKAAGFYKALELPSHLSKKLILLNTVQLFCFSYFNVSVQMRSQGLSLQCYVMSSPLISTKDSTVMRP